MRTAAMHIAHINYSYTAALDDGSMLARILTLTSICEEQVKLGARVTVLQRFWRSEDIEINGVTYRLRRDATSAANARP